MENDIEFLLETKKKKNFKCLKINLYDLLFEKKTISNRIQNPYKNGIQTEFC